MYDNIDNASLKWLVNRHLVFVCDDFVCVFGIFYSDLESNIAGINEDLKNFESQLKFASEIQSVAEVLCNIALKI